LSPFSPAAPAGRAGFSSVMAPNLDGDTYWFHRQLDFRDLSRK
jgi:peptide/nickel transport system substrate-binding protein